MKNRILVSVMLIPAIMFFLASCGSSNRITVEDNLEEIVNTRFSSFLGGRHSIADFEGKIVVLDFWETWCTPCLITFPGFQRAIDDFPDNIVVLAATPGWSNSAEDVRKFAAEHDYDFIYVEAGRLSRQLGIRAIPYKIIIAPDGSLVSHGSGTRGADAEYQALANLVEKYF